LAGQLKQLHVSFNPVEDRLLFLISMEEGGAVFEFRFWITRRFVRLIWQQVDQILEKDLEMQGPAPPGRRETFRQLQQEAALSSTDFTTPYNATSAKTPLGPTPLLLNGCKAEKEATGNCSVVLMTANGQSINLSLSMPLVHSLRKLLAEQTTAAGWDLSLSIFNPGAAYFVKASNTIN